MSATPLIGLDAGSTTVKLCALYQGHVVRRVYRRHQGRVLDEALALAAEARAALGGGTVVVTGSAGGAVADRLGAAFVHEVHAVAAAARRADPQVRTVIELGGQDTKLLHLGDGGALATDMNERCAAGTGMVIDRCMLRLGLEAGALASLVERDAPPPVVSARCGVFAEADVVALVKRGHREADVLLGLLDAIVRQNLVSLARGRPLPGPVLLLGGPVAFIPALAAAFERHLLARWRELGLPAAEVRVPADAALFAALGAAVSGPELDRVALARGSRARLSPRAMPAEPRVGAAWLAHAAVPPPSARARSAARGERLAIGLDAGSTTVKGVALGEDGGVVATAYRAATGDVFTDAGAVLAELAGKCAPGESCALGVTGYAADLLGPVLDADVAELETLAHARAARAMVPGAQVVCDVGGQDIKVLVLDGGGAVKSFRLSHQCAAGNGALLASTASALGVPLEHIAAVTAEAAAVPRFSLGCAVFLDTERVTAQRDGVPPADVLAGMTAVLPRNIWENVAGPGALDTLGDVFVLSGGVQRNAAAVAAQVDYLTSRHPRARVAVHPWPGEAGAIGAALAAREVGRRPGRDLLQLARSLEVTTETGERTRCGLCPSRCARTFVTAHRAGGAHTAVTGNACERGGALAPGARPPKRGVNLVRLEAARLFHRHHAVQVVSRAGAGLRIAIPRVLAQYRAAPLFTHYFEALGVRREDLVTGEPTSEALWRRAAGRGTADACYPAKVAQAHVADLLGRAGERPFDVLFFPAVTRAVTAVKGCADTASCPVVAGTPLVTKIAFGASVDGVLPGGTLLLSPVLELPNKRQLSQALFDAMRTVCPGLTRAEHDAALQQGIAGQRAWDRRLEELGAKLLLAARRDRRCAVVMIGRPYHADPGLHHELSSELAAGGRSVLTLRALPHSPDLIAAAGLTGDPHDLADVPFLTNSGDGERLAAARCVGSLPWLVAIEVSSFKCGQDASLYSHVADAARGAAGKPFLALHDLDETRPVASLRLRLRTFVAAVERYERRLETA
ncbi:MAG: hypothetical protein IPJ65_13865 [Archangiaceae bacterium]|nr:hypothetical protein [Archangiaceae bacterium]